MNPDALTWLRTIDAPLGVIAVAGMYRTGKSYLLNRVLLNRNTGFGVGNTVNACTKVRRFFAKPTVNLLFRACGYGRRPLRGEHLIRKT